MLDTVRALETPQWTLPIDTLLHGGSQTLGAQVEALLKKLQHWSNEHSHMIGRADVRVIAPDDLLFVVMQKGIPYDFDLSEHLTDLDIEIARSADFNLITLNVQTIPRCSSSSAQAFIDWDTAIHIAHFTDNA